MRKEPLLTAVPPVAVRSLSELYAIALDQAQRATQRYGAIATQMDERLSPVRSVFEALATSEQNRSDSLSAACLAACGKRPDASDLRWARRRPIFLLSPARHDLQRIVEQAVAAATSLRPTARASKRRALHPSSGSPASPWDGSVRRWRLATS